MNSVMHCGQRLQEGAGRMNEEVFDALVGVLAEMLRAQRLQTIAMAILSLSVLITAVSVIILSVAYA